jgi:hypothetical protein
MFLIVVPARRATPKAINLYLKVIWRTDVCGRRGNGNGNIRMIL